MWNRIFMALWLAMLATPGVAVAGDFADSFKAFVLGSEAANATRLMAGRTSEASRDTGSSRGPRLDSGMESRTTVQGCTGCGFDPIGEAAARASAPAQGLDSVSRDCVQCHNSPRHAGGARAHSHPVGINYDHTVFSRPQDYRPRASLPGAVRLVDGQVGCASCHQLKSAEPLAALGAVPVPVSGCTATREFSTGGRRDRELCLACHAK
jgi:hypothetical protein